MNKIDLEIGKSHKLFIIGSARGVNRFYLTNKFIENYPEAKVINTGVLINNLAKGINLGNISDISISSYCQYLEPIFIENILAHLEHSDVILDTHFYHLMPCISIKGLQSLIDRISKAIIVLVDEDPLKIYSQMKSRGDKWFDSLDNIKYDIFANKIYFEFYQNFFSNFMSKESLYFNIDCDNISIVDEFIKKLKDK